MSRTRKIRVLSTALLCTLALSGCSQLEPFQREGIWKPSGANDANMSAMVANPADLTRGRGDATGNFRTSTGAVERLWQGAPQRTPAAQGGVAGGMAARQGGGGEAPR